MRKKKEKDPNTHIQRKKFDWFSFLTVLLAVLVGFEAVIGTVGIVTVNAMLKDKPTLNIEELYSQESTRIFDKDGNQISDVGQTLRENVTYDEIPESLIDAFLSIEDSRFFTHNGFDVARFAASAVRNLKSGSASQGGSTFTMQLVKLTYFFTDDGSTTANRDIEYKVQQIALAMELEKQASKKEIFELYLNKMNFGGSGNIRGVEKAAEYYFNKRVTQLNLAESALLAGIINSPYYYDPMNYLDYSTQRRNQVLDMMLRHGYITQEEHDLAKSIKVEDLLYDHSQDTASTDADPNQAYIDQVLTEAQTITGQDPLTIAMDIQTAMDPDVQNESYQICAGNVDSIAYPSDNMEVGFITVNNSTGEIIAIGGGRNYTTSNSAMLLNHATSAYHNPGSCVKPFFSYALAFEYLGWATSHVVTDKPVGSSSWVFQNFDGVYHGDVTLEYAIQTSLNTPAIQALQEEISKVGLNTVEDYFQSLDFSQYSASTFDLSWAIGGNQFTTNPEEIAGATSMLYNGGKYIKPHCITGITYRSGFQDPITVSDLDAYQPKQVLSDAAAYLSAYMMNKVVNSSEYNYAQILKRDYQTFAKSGTSDYGDAGLEYGIPEGARKDKWMTCATSEYTIAAWNGFDKADANETSYFTDAWDSLNIPGKICSDLLDTMYSDGSAPADLTKPDDVVEITHIKGVFPYVKTIDGMDSKYITTGYVKKGYETLADPEKASSISDLSSFTASMADDDNTVQFNWAAYPDTSKLTVASGTKDISLKDGNTVIKAATGTRMFDYSWVYGPIQYKATVSQNGNKLAEIATSSENYTQAIDNLEPETETQVCGYYGYEKLGGDGQQVCTTFTSPEAKFTLPTSGTYDEIKAWLQTNGLSVKKISEEHTDGKETVGQVTISDGSGNDVTGQKLKRSAFSSCTITVIAD